MKSIRTANVARLTAVSAPHLAPRRTGSRPTDVGASAVGGCPANAIPVLLQLP